MSVQFRERRASLLHTFSASRRAVPSNSQGVRARCDGKNAAVSQRIRHSPRVSRTAVVTMVVTDRPEGGAALAHLYI